MTELHFWRRLVLFCSLLGLFAVAVVSASSQTKSATTVILVRHAEKKNEPENKDVLLSPAGEARAGELARMLGNAGVTAIYATQYQRTQQTVKPLATKLSITVTNVEAGNPGEVAKQIKTQHAGGVVFVAGHNNSVPAIIAELGAGTMPIIPETEYDNMFVVTIDGTGRATLLKLKFGSSLPVSSQQMMAQP